MKISGCISFRWCFLRTANQVTQNIVIAKDLYSNGVRVEIITSERSFHLEIKDLTYGPQYMFKDYWEYLNDEEFIEGIEEPGNLIVIYGIDKFDEISQPKVPHTASEELKIKLYNKQTELENNYLFRYQIKSKDNQAFLYHIVDDRLELAAVIGSLFIRAWGVLILFRSGRAMQFRRNSYGYQIFYFSKNSNVLGRRGRQGVLKRVHRVFKLL